MITKKADIYKICSHPSLDFYILPNQENHGKPGYAVMI